MGRCLRGLIVCLRFQLNAEPSARLQRDQLNEPCCGRRQRQQRAALVATRIAAPCCVNNAVDGCRCKMPEHGSGHHHHRMSFWHPPLQAGGPAGDARRGHGFLQGHPGGEARVLARDRRCLRVPWPFPAAAQLPSCQ